MATSQRSEIMGGGILSKLLSRADNKIYDGLVGLSKYPNGIGMSRELLKQKTSQRLNNLNDIFETQNPSPLLGRDNIKIRDTGGGGMPMLQEAYAKLTKRK